MQICTQVKIGSDDTIEKLVRNVVKLIKLIYHFEMRCLTF